MTRGAPARLVLRGPLEQDRQAETLAWLKAKYPEPGAWWSRVNTGVDTSHGRWIPYGLGGRGAPDIFGTCESLAIGIEMKAEDGRLTPDQQAWRDRHLAAGGIYVVARCYREALEGVARALAERRAA